MTLAARQVPEGTARTCSTAACTAYKELLLVTTFLYNLPDMDIAQSRYLWCTVIVDWGVC
jgi:hypothetical protein